MNRILSDFVNTFGDKKIRRNAWALLRYGLVIVSMIVLYSVLFHILMVQVEGQPSSWVTALYWTLTTMSTVGYGDVVFVSDLGRLFSIVVLISGIILIFIVLPFIFIRFFYEPWLETQLRKQTPRKVPSKTKGHVIICTYDSIAPGLIERLEQEHIPYYVIESDLDVASEHYLAGISVVMGELDNRETYEALRVEQARMVFANHQDPVNTNIILTVREVSETVPIVSIAREGYAVEVLQLSGATHVLPLNQWLGEQLANRLNTSHAQAHVIGRYRDLRIAELPIRHTPLVGKAIRETRLREITGVSIIGVWERGRLHPARPEMELTNASVPIIIGTEDQLNELDSLLIIYDFNPNPIVVIGAGAVGTAAVRALKHRDIALHLIEQDPEVCMRMHDICDEVIRGDATDPSLLLQAGIKDAPSVLLTTGTDALNIYLATQCRRLNPDLRIVGRISHEQNIESIHRAGADFVLGSALLGVEAATSILKGKELIVLGEGVDLFSMKLPKSLNGKTLSESGIGERTALTVIAVEQNGSVITSPPATTVLEPGAELLMFGDAQQRQTFVDLYR